MIAPASPPIDAHRCRRCWVRRRLASASCATTLVKLSPRTCELSGASAARAPEGVASRSGSSSAGAAVAAAAVAGPDATLTAGGACTDCEGASAERWGVGRSSTVEEEEDRDTGVCGSVGVATSATVLTVVATATEGAGAGGNAEAEEAGTLGKTEAAGAIDQGSCSVSEAAISGTAPSDDDDDEGAVELDRGGYGSATEESGVGRGGSAWEWVRRRSFGGNGGAACWRARRVSGGSCGSESDLDAGRVIVARAALGGAACAEPDAVTGNIAGEAVADGGGKGDTEPGRRATGKARAFTAVGATPTYFFLPKRPSSLCEGEGALALRLR